MPSCMDPDMPNMRKPLGRAFEALGLTVKIHDGQSSLVDKQSKGFFTFLRKGFFSRFRAPMGYCGSQSFQSWDWVWDDFRWPRMLDSSGGTSPRTMRCPWGVLGTAMGEVIMESQNTTH